MKNDDTKLISCGICPTCKQKIYKLEGWIDYIVTVYIKTDKLTAENLPFYETHDLKFCSWNCKKKYEREHKDLVTKPYSKMSYIERIFADLPTGNKKG